MRRLSLALLALLLLAGCAATRREGSGGAVCDCAATARVPDRHFRQLLLDRGLAANAGRGRLRPTPEGCALTTLECYGQDIGSLRGIELFPQLQEVVCSDNPLHELDLNALPHLERLYALNVPLEHIALDSCRQLRRLQLSHTQLTRFDLRPFADLELLLLIFSPLTELDFGPCNRLTTLYIRGTRIEEVDLRPCPDFHELHALDTPLRTIVVTEAQRKQIRASVGDSVRVEVRQSQ